MNNLDNDYQAPQTASPVGTALKYGIIGGFVLIVLSLIAYLLDMSESSIIRVLQFAILVVIVVVAIKAHRDNDLNGTMSYGRGLGVGTLTALFASLVVAVYMFIFLNFIDTGFIDEQIENSRREMIERDMSDEEIEQAMNMTKMFLSPVWLTVITVITNTFFGFITALIASAFIKK